MGAGNRSALLTWEIGVDTHPWAPSRRHSASGAERSATVPIVHRDPDDPSLTSRAGLLLAAPYLNSKLHLVERRDAAVEEVPQFKQRRRGPTCGELLVSLAKVILLGGNHLA